MLDITHNQRVYSWIDMIIFKLFIKEEKVIIKRGGIKLTQGIDEQAWCLGDVGERTSMYGVNY
jgi:hypothetical protein